MGLTEEKVNEICEHQCGHIVDSTGVIYTSKNQRFAIIINKVLWYVVRLVLEIDERCDDLEVIKVSEHFTLHEAEKIMYNLIDNLCNKSPPVYEYWHYLRHHESQTSIAHIGCYLEIPNDVRCNPDEYLRPGDFVIVFNNTIGSFHTGIYVGDEKLVLAAEETCENRTMIFETSWSDFNKSNSENAEICIYCNLLRLKTPDEIIKTAKSLIGEYERRFDNGRYFSCYCQTGVEFCPTITYDRNGVPEPLKNFHQPTNIGKTLTYYND